jgi:uncharacterized phiE125 gp8 family phage protein
MQLLLHTAPAVEPVSLNEAKSHLRVDTTAEDAYITALIKAARQATESYTHRAFITQTWDLFLDRFTPIITLPRPALQTVTHVKYTAPTGDLETLDPGEYQVSDSKDPGRILPALGTSWPHLADVADAVQVRFVTGYGNAAAVPEPIQWAIKLILADLYDNRGNKDMPMPQAAQHLLNPYRMVSI